MKSSRVVVLVTTLALGAGVLVASNMGFKLVYTLQQSAGTTGTNWMSLPYFWNGTATAATVCTDIGAAASEVGRYIESTDTFESWVCGARAVPFTLTEGQGIYVKATNGTSWTIVGSHDDAKTITLAQSAGSTGTNWVSVPYHKTATTASDICTQIGAAASEVGRYIESSDAFEAWVCGARAVPFTLVVGQAVYVKATNGTTWTPAHY